MIPVAANTRVRLAAGVTDKAQAILVERLRHQLAGHRAHRFGTSSGTAEQLQLALEGEPLRRHWFEPNGERGRWRFAAPRAFVARIGPEPCGLGLAGAGGEHADRRVIHCPAGDCEAIRREGAKIASATGSGSPASSPRPEAAR